MRIVPQGYIEVEVPESFIEGYRWTFMQRSNFTRYTLHVTRHGVTCKCVEPLN
jgi:hypothetical protein